MGDPAISAVSDTNWPGTNGKDSTFSTSNQNRRTSGAMSRVSSSAAVIGGCIPAPFAFPGALDQDLCHRRMAVERRGDVNLQFLDAGRLRHDSRKIALQVQAEGEEIRSHQNACGSAG